MRREIVKNNNKIKSGQHKSPNFELLQTLLYIQIVQVNSFIIMFGAGLGNGEVKQGGCPRLMLQNKEIFAITMY